MSTGPPGPTDCGAFPPGLHAPLPPVTVSRDVVHWSPPWSLEHHVVAATLTHMVPGSEVPVSHWRRWGGHVQKEACCAWSRREAPRTQNLSPRPGPLTADPLAQNRTRSRGRAGWPWLLLSLTFIKPSASRWPKGARMTDASRLKSIRFEVCLGWKLSNLTDNAAAQALGGRQTVSRGPRHTVSWVGRSQPGGQSISLGGVTVTSCRTYGAHSSPVRLSGPGSAEPSRGPASAPAGEPGAGRDVTAEGR